jgi:TonB family protein
VRFLLVGPDYEENLSLRYLSASLLQAGHESVLAPFNSSVDAAAVANAAQAVDAVGLSMCFQARAGEFLGLARLLKFRDPRKLIVAGGHYASCAAEPLLANHPEIDLVVIHEGERALVEIAAAMPRLAGLLPAIPGIAYRDGLHVCRTAPRAMVDDLDSLPFPDRRGPVYWIAGVPTSYLMGSRGCYGSCAYCCITTLHRMAPGKRFRQRRVSNIADEMAQLYRERGTRQFIFHDDNFLVPSEEHNHARIAAFEAALHERRIADIALVVKCRPADATLDVLRRMQSLGLIRVFLGVESATAAGLSALQRDQKVEESERALEICASLGISAQYTLMTFHPDATLETLRADIAFMRRFSANPLNFCRAEIYAGTPLEQSMIASGRAMGDYRARTYQLPDPVADLACRTSLRVFHDRCWANGSLMQNAIGLDHAAAVARRFPVGAHSEILARRVEDWLRRVNLDTIELLDQAVSLAASNARFEDSIRDLAERESFTRRRFSAEAAGLRVALQALRLPSPTLRHDPPSAFWPRLARPAAAALLAIGLPAAVQSQTPPPAASAGQEKSTRVLSGRVVDPTGAVVPDVKITVTNLDTAVTRIARTDTNGLYTVSNLPAGRYTIKAEMPGFRTAERPGIVLQAGATERIDVGLTLEIGCCEYVAVAAEAPKPQGNLRERKKPFTYIVGDADDRGTFQGIARLVYGDERLWPQIFEANRGVLLKPGTIPFGTAIFIPKARHVPKLLHKVAPVYPPQARQQHTSGDVLLDVALDPDGAVNRVELIDGNPLLADSAMAAVGQWRYRPLVLGGQPVLKLVVLVSFGKDGKVRTF